MIRLFNENGCETPTDNGWGVIVRDAILPLIKDAVDAGISLRDVQTLIIEEASVICAEERLRRGMNERRLIRLAAEQRMKSRLADEEAKEKA